jgi:deoxycytidine triphosphate deaminase
VSVLTDVDLLRAIRGKHIAVSGLTGEEEPGGAVQPASIDLTLSSDLLGFPRAETLWRAIDPERPPTMEPRGWRDGAIELPPPPPNPTDEWESSPKAGLYYPLQYGEMILGSTAERLTIGRNHVGRIEGKSTLGRLGLFVHVSAGWIDCGWGAGSPMPITLELLNMGPGPFILRPGMKIAQLAVYNVSTTSALGYGHERLGSKYDGSYGTVGARP